MIKIKNTFDWGEREGTKNYPSANYGRYKRSNLKTTGCSGTTTVFSSWCLKELSIGIKRYATPLDNGKVVIKITSQTISFLVFYIFFILHISYYRKQTMFSFFEYINNNQNNLLI